MRLIGSVPNFAYMSSFFGIITKSAEEPVIWTESRTLMNRPLCLFSQSEKPVPVFFCLNYLTIPACRGNTEWKVC